MKKSIDFLYTIFVALAPALAVYNFVAGTSLGSLILLILSVPYFICHGTHTLSRDYLQFFAVVMGITLVVTALNLFSSNSWFDFTLMAHNAYSIVICFIPLVLATYGINVKVLVNSLLVFGLIASGTIIWQRLQLALTGYFEADLFMPWFEVNRNLESFSISRPSAFFTEPAHFSIFMLPIMYIAVLYKNYIYTGIFFLAILCSGSTTGFLLSTFLLAYAVFLNTEKGKRAKTVTLTVIGCIVLLGGILVLFPSIILQNVAKLQETDSTSNTLRLFGQLQYVDLYGIKELLFGVSLNQMVNYVQYQGINTAEVYNYSNSILYMMICYGIVGFVYFAKFLWKQWKRTTVAKGFMISYIGILASDQIFFNMHFLYLASLALLADRINDYIINDNKHSKLLII